MGYNTDFDGEFEFNKKLDLETYIYLKDFAEADHRDDKDVPGIWCQWEPTKDGLHLRAEGEKFYNYTEWLNYLIEKVFIPKDYVLNGEVNWYGDDHGDAGLIMVKDNVVTVKQGKMVYD